MMKLSGDRRKITIKFCINDDENQLFEEKFVMSRCKSKSWFMRTIIFKRLIIKLDDKKLKKPKSQKTVDRHFQNEQETRRKNKNTLE